MSHNNNFAGRTGNWTLPEAPAKPATRKPSSRTLERVCGLFLPLASHSPRGPPTRAQGEARAAQSNQQFNLLTHHENLR
jgi:hypothetical protein